MRDRIRRAPLALVAIPWFILAGPVPWAEAQLSPGPLSQAHADLEGVKNCLRCHGIGEESLDGRCLACHDEIRWYREKDRGLHGGDQECVDCHLEHGGVDFEVVRWERGSPERFQHTRAGWPLDGKHADLRCRQCHTPEHHDDVLAEASRWASNAATWLGMPTDCAACHTDPHEGRLGTQCAECHTTSSFREVSADRFDHAATRFALRGRHASVECIACHRRDGVEVARPAFARCVDCHADPHAGDALLADVVLDCDGCHDPSVFRPSTLTLADHERTRYPLEGAHRRVACAACHRTESADPGAAGFEFRPAGGSCTDCHEDVHGGQLSERRDGGACETCHVVERFSPSTFAVADHAATDFALEGAHATITCRDCHGPERRALPQLPGPEVLGAAGVAFHPGAADCDACHFDPHGGRFSIGGTQPVEEGCRKCHGSDSFLRVSLDASDHARLGFPLDGAHAAVPCLDCHVELAREPSESSLLLAATSPAPLPFDAASTCRECHADPHGDQFRSRRDGSSCDSCHGPDRFRPAPGFDHGRDVRFVLDGAHVRVDCGSCHQPGFLPDGSRGIVYRGTPRECVDCHAVLPPLSGGDS